MRDLGEVARAEAGDGVCVDVLVGLRAVCGQERIEKRGGDDGGGCERHRRWLLAVQIVVGDWG